MDVPNPLMPVPLGVVFAGIAACSFLLTVGALASLFGRSRRLAPAQYLGWTLTILFVPLVGAGLWFRETRHIGPRPIDGRAADDDGRRP